MRKKNITCLAMILLALIGVAAAGCGKLFSKEEKEPIHIALVGPMTGTSESVGRAFRQGVQLYVDKVNKEEGGVHGRKIVIDATYDDHNNPEMARSEAFRIVEGSKSVAVIGHHYSSCSISAGEIYKEYGIPAITPASTNVNVTIDNPWYFRCAFNDNLQGRFLANYARMVFQKSRVSIIYENDDYGRYLSEVFENTSKELGSEIKYKWSFNADDRLLEDTLSRIIYDLKSRQDAGVVFLCTHAGPGIQILKLMKDALVLNQVMGPDAFASEVFRSGFDQFPKERRNPGFYTNGMYVTTPLIYDTTNEQGQRFQELYQRTYKEIPGWHAAFAYDSALVLIHAIKNIDYDPSPDAVAENRRKIRNFLASMNSVENAVEGVTGYNYFDAKGDAQKPVYIGVYKNQNIISALTQFQTISNPAELSYLEDTRKKERVMLFDGHYMYRINVVYTGIEINEVSDLNFKEQTCYLDFNLWFRYQGDLKLNDIVFLNNAETITLGEPVQKKITPDNLSYYQYHIKGRFRMNFIPERFVYGEHIVGVSFRHPEMDRNNLIYVKDVLGMGKVNEETAMLEKMDNDQILSRGLGWKLKQVSFFQDNIEETSLGNPEYLNITGGASDFSRFNVCIRIVPDKFLLRNIIPDQLMFMVFLASLMVFLGLPILARTRRFEMYKRIFWMFQFMAMVPLLVTLEYYCIKHWGGTYFLGPAVRFVDLLWWVISATFINLGVRLFIWNRLEELSGRDVPRVIKNAIVLLVYVIASFGIVAFVFDQKLTSLLASTGVAAMIFGLALQVNISNIFSGIAINLERPFRVGDWVKIGDYKEGKVIDINWRTTRIMTRDDTIISISNSRASESAIENFSFPDDAYYQYFTVHVDPSQPPDRVKKVLLDAALAAEGVEKDPMPSTRFLGLTAGMTGQSESWAANYLISVYVRDYGKKFAHNESVWNSVWSQLRRAGIKHVMTRQEMHMVVEGIRPRKALPPSKSFAVLEEMEIFQPFPHEAKVYLAQNMKRYHFYPAECIVQQGEEGNSLFIIEEGVVSIRVQFDAQQRAVEVARMGAGNFFGEMALLTGEKRTASIFALTETYLYEITKDDIAPLIEKEPRISRLLSDILTKRKMSTEARKPGEEMGFDKATLATQIFNKIQTFFGFKRP
jgi:branched-chain amino acid transport system substrate-binding protein